MVRASELKSAGIAATTISRAVAEGKVLRIGRGLYQLPGVEVDVASALDYHELSDQMPRKVWIAIGAKDWAPKVDYPPLRITRFRPPNDAFGVERHRIGGVEVPIYSVAKSLSDAFRNPKLLDRSVAIECLRSAVRSRNSTPAEIAETAQACGAWNQMRPYLEAVTQDG